MTLDELNENMPLILTNQFTQLEGDCLCVFVNTIPLKQASTSLDTVFPMTAIITGPFFFASHGFYPVFRLSRIRSRHLNF